MSLLAAYWDRRPKPLALLHLIVSEERKPPPDANPLHLIRQPGILNLPALAVVEVDGEPFASPEPDVPERRKWRIRPPQGDLFPAPRTLAGKATGGALIEAAAALALHRDERSPLRGDLIRAGGFAYALTGAARLTDAEGAILIGGADTPANRKRFNRALWALRYARYEASPGIFWVLADAEPGGVNRIGPARWWLDYMRVTEGLTGKARRDALRRAGFDGRPVAWRYTGGLFRRVRGGGGTRGPSAGYWGARAWGSSAGRGKRGRTPDNLRPVRKGGPGPDVFIPWWQVLRLAGENVGPDADAKGPEGRRYRRRCDDLRSAGYFADRTGTAPSGDTVEIVGQQRGSRARRAGLIVRASARYCAIYAGGGERTRIPAVRVLGEPRGAP